MLSSELERNKMDYLKTKVSVRPTGNGYWALLKAGTLMAVIQQVRTDPEKWERRGCCAAVSNHAQSGYRPRFPCSLTRSR